VDVADLAAPLVALDDHPPRGGADVAALDRLADIAARLGQVEGPVHPVVAVLQGERPGVTREREPSVIDRRHEVGEVRAGQRTRLDDLRPTAEVSGLHAVRDEAAQAAALNGRRVGSWGVALFQAPCQRAVVDFEFRRYYRHNGASTQD